jgi:hypothetical protein
MKIRKGAAIAAAGLTLILLAGCGPALIRVDEPVTRDTQLVPLENVKAVDARLQMGAGELNVEGGAASAMDGTFEFRPRSWQPQVHFEIESTTAVVTVSQAHATDMLPGSLQNKWDVRFNNALPLRLTVESGVGKSTLTLGELPLVRLNVMGGVGDTTIDLGRKASRDVSVQITGGVGKITLLVPREAGVRVWGYQDGVGKFDAAGFVRKADENALFNDAYGKPGVKQYDISVQRGVGDVTIEQR